MVEELTDYTVLGFYGPNHQIWREEVSAVNADQAAWKAVMKILRLNSWGEERLEDILVVEVITGDFDLQLENGEVLSGDELKQDPRDWAPRKP